MSIGIIIVVLIGVIILYGAIVGIRGQRQWSKKFPQQLANAGFVPSPEAKEHIENTIFMLFHQEANIINEIDNIKKVQFKNKDIYFCEVTLGGKGKYDLIFTDLFIFPLRAKKEQPLLLFLKSDSADGAAYTKDIITKKNVLSDLYKPDGLATFDLPPRPDLNTILYAYGESSSPLDDILGPSSLRQLVQAGKQGFFIFYYMNGMAALLTLARYKNHAIYKIEWTRQWQYVQELLRIT